MLRRLAISLAATSALALAGAGPALAAQEPITVPLQEDHKGTVAEDFDTQACDDQFDALNLDETKDGWHFVAPDQTGGFVKLTLTFTDLNDTSVEVNIDSQDPSDPSTGPGWAGYFSTVGQGVVRHAWVVTEAGWTLEDGTAEVVSADGSFFVLSHTCPGVPGDDGDGGNGDGDGGNGDGDGGNGDGDGGNGDGDGDGSEDGKGGGDGDETPAAVPTAVPAGASGSSDASMAPVGIAAAALMVVAGGATLLRRRFAHQS